MKYILISVFSLLIGTSSALYVLQGNGQEIRETSTPLKTEEPKILVYSPSILESVRSVEVPETQTTLLSDTQREHDLLYSLSQNPKIKESSRVESVNCLENRCQILVEPLSDAARLAFVEHLEAHPQFGRSVRLAIGGDKENKSLLTFVYAEDTQVSTTH